MIVARALTVHRPSTTDAVRISAQAVLAILGQVTSPRAAYARLAESATDAGNPGDQGAELLGRRGAPSLFDPRDEGVAVEARRDLGNRMCDEDRTRRPCCAD